MEWVALILAIVVYFYAILVESQKEIILHLEKELENEKKSEQETTKA